MFKKDVVLEVGSSQVNIYYLDKKMFSRKIRKYIYSFQEVNSTQTFLNRRYNYSVLLTSEDIKTDIYRFPEVKKKLLPNLVENELYFRTGEKDNIFFNYVILKSEKNNTEIAVIYFNTNKLKFIESELSSNIKVKGVFTLQLCILNLYKNKIKTSNFVFIFYYNDSYYCLYCIENRIYDCCSFNEFENIQLLKSYVYNFIEKNKIFSEVNPENFYVLNIEQTVIEDIIPEGCRIENLGKIDESSIIRAVLQ